RALPEFDPSRHLLILVDEVALPLGKFRLRGAGSAGGHNGLKSIEGALQRQDYARLRIGVGPKPPEMDDLADYVLAEFTSEERETLEGLLDPMADAVECWLAEGIERAMTKFNK
ncbi:MAG TPA: aminoacyl-tRNA hydrolase, partial [Gemmatimonadales bacterium]|nr:aminoacyl-tRNA hydrolase [Gemmatimonadales bacterium]